MARPDNANGARAKLREAAVIPVSTPLVRLYSEYMHAEYGDLDCDYVFVNLFGGRTGQPLCYPTVHRLAAYRGIGDLSGLVLAAEIIDWRRFATAPLFMGFTGLVPSEYSTGEATRRGHVTKAGNRSVRTTLVEAAHAYRHRPAVGATLKTRQRRVEAVTVARSWTAQQRLCGRYRRMSAQHKPTGVIVTAIARELAGFCWAEMTS